MIIKKDKFKNLVIYDSINKILIKYIEQTEMNTKKIKVTLLNEIFRFDLFSLNKKPFSESSRVSISFFFIIILNYRSETILYR